MAAGRVRNLILGALALLGAAAASEAFLRLTVEKEMLFDTWFTPGINAPDRKFGFVYAGNYRGYMRHPDRVWEVPLQLDAHGFRRANRGRGGGPVRRVVVIGGVSIMMCYGLTDPKTVTGRMAAASRHNLEVQNTAWPGFSVYRNWHVLREKLGGTENFEAAVVALYGTMPRHFATLPEGFEALPPPPPQEELFRFADDLVVRRHGRLQYALGRHYYRSFVAYKFLRVLDRLLGEYKKPDDFPDGYVTTATGERVDVSRYGLRRFTEFMRYLNRRLDAEDTKMLVVFLPRKETRKDFYALLTAAVPDGIPRVDLHRDLAATLSRDRFMADMHYGEELAGLIGRRLAEEVDRVLDGAD